MQPIFRALGRVLTAGVAGVAGVLAGASVPGAQAAEGGPPGNGTTQRTIDWRPCAQDATADCGTLRLPVDWARPSGETFDLAVARRKATDPDRRIGVLLVNPGGPGESGVDYAIRRAPGQFSAEIQEQFDIVGFDPRGVGGSQPVRCSTELLDQRPSAYPRNQAEFDRLAAYNRELREDCRRNSGPVFAHADTLSVVHDMDAIRVSLGEQKINYFGHSYGTMIGQQYAEEYGDRIRSMVLTANLDHSLGTRDFLVSSAATAEDSLDQFVKWCESTPSCALYGRDVTAVWDELLARADRGEIRDPDNPDALLTANDITLAAFKDFYGPNWAKVATYLAQLDAQEPAVHEPSVDEPSVQDPAAQDHSVQDSTAREPGEERTGQATTAEPFHAVFCQDWRFRPKDYQEYADLTAAELRAAPHMRGSPRVHTAMAGCVGWPEEVNNPQHRLRITEAPGILVLQSMHDPANPYTWATNVHRQTRGTTVLLPYEGAGHSVYRRSDCTRDAVDDHLTERKLPRPGSSCAAVAVD